MDFVKSGYTEKWCLPLGIRKRRERANRVIPALGGNNKEHANLITQKRLYSDVSIIISRVLLG